jgi:hypothetical protein
MLVLPDATGELITVSGKTVAFPAIVTVVLAAAATSAFTIAPEMFIVPVPVPNERVELFTLIPPVVFVIVRLPPWVVTPETPWKPPPAVAALPTTDPPTTSLRTKNEPAAAVFSPAICPMAFAPPSETFPLP